MLGRTSKRPCAGATKRAGGPRYQARRSVTCWHDAYPCSPTSGAVTGLSRMVAGAAEGVTWAHWAWPRGIYRDAFTLRVRARTL
jgi:hypothetical protein